MASLSKRRQRSPYVEIPPRRTGPLRNPLIYIPDPEGDMADPGSSASSTSDIIVLEEAPAHLRRRSNAHKPIHIDSSDNEDEGRTRRSIKLATTHDHDNDNDHDNDPDHDDEEDEDFSFFTREEKRLRKELMLDPKTSSGKRKRADSVSSTESEKKQLELVKKQSLELAVQHHNKRVRIHDARGNENEAGPSNFGAHAVDLDPDDGPLVLEGVSGPSTEVLSAEQVLPRLLEILPDLCTDYALGKLRELADLPPSTRVEQAMAAALDEEGGHPKRKESTPPKRPADEPGAKDGYRGAVFRAKHRMGAEYNRLSAQVLEAEFPLIPVPHIRLARLQCDWLFGPVYYRLLREQGQDPNTRSYVELKRPRPSRKQPDDGYEAAQASRLPGADQSLGADEFHREWAAIKAETLAEKTAMDLKAAQQLAKEAELAEGHGIECGCCFGEDIWDNMIQCCEGHLFCKECAISHAEIKLGLQQISIMCMDASNCTALYSESELARFLPDKSLELYFRLKQMKDLEDAGIDGLESCPNCPWAVIIDNPDEKLLRCMNDNCLQISCRKCRRPTCEEMEADRKLDKRHAIEDAMTDALIRKCPKCQKPYVKEMGCNKMTCHHCRTLSCYICQKAIAGYDHFDSNYSRPKAKGKCPLWDKNEAQTENERIVAARDAAQAQARQAALEEGLELDEVDVAVDMPAVVPAPNPPGHPAMPNAGHGIADAVQQHMVAAALGLARPDQVARIPVDVARRHDILAEHHEMLRQVMLAYGMAAVPPALAAAQPQPQPQPQPQQPQPGRPTVALPPPPAYEAEPPFQLRGAGRGAQLRALQARMEAMQADLEAGVRRARVAQFVQGVANAQFQPPPPDLAFGNLRQQLQAMRGRIMAEVLGGRNEPIQLAPGVMEGLLRARHPVNADAIRILLGPRINQRARPASAPAPAPAPPRIAVPVVAPRPPAAENARNAPRRRAAVRFA